MQHTINTNTHVLHLPGSSARRYLEVAALTQGVVADVQVAVAARLAHVMLQSLGRGHAQQAGLGERLQVVGRHAPELEVRLVPEEPEDGGRPPRVKNTEPAPPRFRPARCSLCGGEIKLAF